MSSQVQRKLTTILAADADGYSAVMEADEVATLTALRAAREVFAKFIARHHGRIANTAGDGLIAEFPSVVEAVQCAIEVQRELGAAPDQGGLRFRIGVHLGDVLVDGDDLLGEGVNLAARLQTMAEPGAILISRQVYDQVQKKLSVGFSYLGEKRPKNFAESVSVYSVGADAAAPARPKQTAARQAAAAPLGAAALGDLRQRSIREARLLGVVAVLLVALNAATGAPVWAQWPVLVMAVILGLRSARLFARGRFKLLYVRIAILIGALALINAFSWSGELWFLWPAGVLVALAAIGRLLSGPS